MVSSLTGIFLSLDYCQKIQLLGLFHCSTSTVLWLLVTKFSIEQCVKQWFHALIGTKEIDSIQSIKKKKTFPNF